ncbi:curli assembly protein CsgF [Citrobacter freundii]|nr:curli assembly protein CsgF [Citrobacter freundii]
MSNMQWFCSMLISPLSWAGNMTFQFRNPNFGGNPNNGSFLLNSAQAQNSYKDPSAGDYGIETPQRWITLPRRYSHKYSVAYLPISIPVSREGW